MIGKLATVTKFNVPVTLFPLLLVGGPLPGRPVRGSETSLARQPPKSPTEPR